MIKGGMTPRLFLSVLLLGMTLDVPAADLPKSVEFVVSVSAAKDVPAVAALLQEQLRRPLALLMEIKDQESLNRAKATLGEVTANVAAVSKRLQELPVPPSEERKALSKKMAESDRAHLKANQPALKAHLASMSGDLKQEAMEVMDGFYKTVEDHKRVFELYLHPDKKAGAKPEKPAAEKRQSPENPRGHYHFLAWRYPRLMVGSCNRF